MHWLSAEILILPISLRAGVQKDGTSGGSEYNIDDIELIQGMISAHPGHMGP